MASPEIRQELDGALFRGLSEEAREAADENGELDGNQHYVDLSHADWGDVAHALKVEGHWIAAYKVAEAPEAVLEQFAEMQEAEEERDALWHLELGVAAPVMTLNAMGAHTVLSCNGGEFGGTHLRQYPSILFYPQRASVQELLQLARDSGVGLIEEDGRALLYAQSVQDFHQFSSLAHSRLGGA